MLLFLLRGTFWLAVVAIALPWFVRGSAQPETSAATARAVAPKLQTAARVAPAPRYFDDVTGSVAPTTADCTGDCAGEPAKVDLIALQLVNASRAPAPATRARTAGDPPATRPAQHRVAAHRPTSISDLLGR